MCFRAVHSEQPRLAAAIAALLVLIAGDGAAQSLTQRSVVTDATGVGLSFGKTLSVPCPEGTQVLSGGFRLLGDVTAGTRLVYTRPSEDGLAWEVQVAQSTPQNFGLEVTAICGVVENRVQVSATSSVFSTAKQLSVECASSLQALGGGAGVAGEVGDVRIQSFGVQSIFDEASSFASAGSEAEWTLTVYLICGSVPDYAIGADDLQGSQNPKEPLAVCSEGRVAVGGGILVGQLSASESAIFQAAPTPDGLGWRSDVEDFGTDAFWTARSIVVCAPEPVGVEPWLATLAALVVLRGCRRRDSAIVSTRAQ